jgi:hypothetical protein
MRQSDGTGRSLRRILAVLAAAHSGEDHLHGVAVGPGDGLRRPAPTALKQRNGSRDA